MRDEQGVTQERVGDGARAVAVVKVAAGVRDFDIAAQIEKRNHAAHSGFMGQVPHAEEGAAQRVVLFADDGRPAAVR